MTFVKTDDRWDDLADADWNQFAACWLNGLADREEGELPKLPQILNEDQDAGAFVVQMNFTASHENQWKFVLAAFENAPDEQLGDIAAGPIKHILWKHGDVYIDKVEDLASSFPRFASMMDGCWQQKQKMSEDVWCRVQAIQDRNKEYGVAGQPTAA